MRAYLIAAVAGAVLLSAALLGLRMYGKAQHADGYAQAQTEQRLAVGRAEAEARRIEQQWRDKFEEIENETQEKLASIVADERRAADVRVRDASAAAAARYRAAAERATAAAEREAADAAIGMFAELLGGLDDLAGIYAAQADRARVAGLACEAASGVRIRSKQ